jgi:single-stranded DNA-binding protein
MFDAKVVGTVTNDPEVKTGKNGKPYCSISLEIHIRNVRTWIRICTFGDDTAKLVGFHKGDDVYVEGSVVQVAYKGKPDVQIIPQVIRVADAVSEVA